MIVKLCLYGYKRGDPTEHLIKSFPSETPIEVILNHCLNDVYIKRYYRKFRIEKEYFYIA